MKKAGFILLVILTLWSCEKAIPEVSFRIETQGFILQETILDTTDAFPSFTHRLSGGIVTFSNNRRTYEFITGNSSIGDFEYRLPEGDYQLTFDIAPASLYGQEAGSFTALPLDVSIDAQTGIIPVHIESNCSMFLVSDEFGQLEQGVFMIERHAYAHGHFWPYPLSTDSISGLYFTYFTPDTVPSSPTAFLWLYGDTPGVEEGGMTTCDLEIGFQYNISILD